MIKYGKVNQKQQFQCKKCKCRFFLKSSKWTQSAYKDYTIHKQTYQELEIKYHKSERTIRKFFDRLNFDKIKNPKLVLKFENSVNCVFDTTFFGRIFGVMIFRINDQNTQIKLQKYKNVIHKFVTSETLIEYENCLNTLDQICPRIRSFTIDGRAGVIKKLELRYPNTPLQMCIFHQVQIVLRYTTRNPKTECGVDLKKLILALKSTTKSEFTFEFKTLQVTYKEFLNESTINPITGRKSYSHKSLRSAFRSIKSHLKYLFTFQDYTELNIQPTSNSCDGSFAHWKPKVKLHRGISFPRKKQIISEILGSFEV